MNNDAAPGGLLYLCYQSIHEPLTDTQVLAYLKGLAAHGHTVWLITFEPTPLAAAAAAEIEKSLQQFGIHWSWLRYHKRPSALATAFDILAGALAGARIARRHRLRWIHARSHVPAAMALLIRRMTQTPFVFDIRGFLAEEYVDAGVWSAHSLLSRLVKRVERRAVREASGLIVLTRKAEQMLRSWYPRESADKPLMVIPCCVEVAQFATQRAPRSDPVRFIYVGKVGGWYWLEAIDAFFRAARAEFSEARLILVTQSDRTQLEALVASHPPGVVSVTTAKPSEMPTQLESADIALCFVRPLVSKHASSPTKIGEYLAAGLPVVLNAGIGDLDALYREDLAIGARVHSPSVEEYRAAARRAVALASDPHTADRCRAVARAEFDLVAVGWQRYRDLYRELER